MGAPRRLSLVADAKNIQWENTNGKSVSDNFLFLWSFHWNHLWLPIPSISAEKNTPCAPVTQYGMIWLEFKTTQCLHWSNDLLAQWGPHDPTQFLFSLNFGGLIISFQSITITLDNNHLSNFGGPAQIISLPGSIDNNNRRIEQWVRINPLIIPSTHDDPIICLRTKRWRGMTWPTKRQRQRQRPYHINSRWSHHLLTFKKKMKSRIRAKVADS